MAHLLSGEPMELAPSSTTGLFAGLVNWFAKAQAVRARRVALSELLEYDENRLDDLGINRRDLFDALEHPSQRPGLRLAQKRAQSSRYWLDP
jgi:uncharacterized protein YjiS (DUF1127 family)